MHRWKKSGRIFFLRSFWRLFFFFLFFSYALFWRVDVDFCWKYLSEIKLRAIKKWWHYFVPLVFYTNLFNTLVIFTLCLSIVLFTLCAFIFITFVLLLSLLSVCRSLSSFCSLLPSTLSFPFLCIFFFHNRSVYLFILEIGSDLFPKLFCLWASQPKYSFGMFKVRVENTSVWHLFTFFFNKLFKNKRCKWEKLPWVIWYFFI